MISKMEKGTWTHKDRYGEFVHIYYDTKEDAILAATRYFAFEHNTFSFTIAQVIDLPQVIYAEIVLDDLSRDIEEFTGEYDAYSDIEEDQIKDLDQELNKTLNKWFEKFKVKKEYLILGNEEIVNLDINLLLDNENCEKLKTLQVAEKRLKCQLPL